MIKEQTGGIIRHIFDTEVYLDGSQNGSFLMKKTLSEWIAGVEKRIKKLEDLNEIEEYEYKLKRKEKSRPLE